MDATGTRGTASCERFQSRPRTARRLFAIAQTQKGA